MFKAHLALLTSTEKISMMHPKLEAERQRCLKIACGDTTLPELPFDSVTLPIERNVYCAARSELKRLGNISCIASSLSGKICFGLGSSIYNLSRETAPVKLNIPPNLPEDVVSSAAVAPDGDTTIVGFKSGLVIVFESSSTSTTVKRIIQDAQATSVCHLCYLKDGSFISSTKDGAIYMHNYRLFGNERQLLINGNSKLTGEILKIKTLRNQSNQGLEGLDLLAIIGEKAVLILKLTPSPSLVMKQLLTDVSDVAWLRCGADSLPLLVVSFGSSLRLLRPSGGTDHVEFHIVSEVSCTARVKQVVGFGESSVFAVSCGSAIEIYQVLKGFAMKRVAVVDMPTDKPYTLTWFTERKVAVVFNDLECQVVTVQPWPQYCKALIHQEKWREALSVTCGIILDKVPPLLDYASIRTDGLTSQVRAILVSYLNGISMVNDKDRLFEIAVDCTNACAVAELTDFLYQEISVFFSGDVARHVYLDVIEQFIIEKRLPSTVDSAIVNALLLRRESGNSPTIDVTLAERLLLNISPENIDCNFAIRYCAKYQLDLSLVVLHNRILGDYVTPMTTLMQVSAKNTNACSTLFFYIYCILHGLPFPAPCAFPNKPSAESELANVLFQPDYFAKLLSLSPELLFASLPLSVDFSSRVALPPDVAQEALGFFYGYLARSCISRGSRLVPEHHFAAVIDHLAKIGDVSSLEKILPHSSLKSVAEVGSVIRSLGRYPKMTWALVHFVKSHSNFQLSDSIRVCKEAGANVVAAFLLEISGDIDGFIEVIAEVARSSPQDAARVVLEICGNLNSFTPSEFQLIWESIFSAAAEKNCLPQLCEFLKDSGALADIFARINVDRILLDSVSFENCLQLTEYAETSLAFKSKLLRFVCLASSRDLGTDFSALASRKANAAKIEVTVGCIVCRDALLTGGKILTFSCGHATHDACRTGLGCPGCSTQF